MLVYKKENGFPCDLTFDSEEHEDLEAGFKGYKTKIIDEEGKVIKEIYHKNLHDRAHWADGYMTALKTKL